MAYKKQKERSKPPTYEEAEDWEKEILFDTMRFCKFHKTEHKASEFGWTSYRDRNTGIKVYVRRCVCYEARRRKWRQPEIVNEAYIIAAKHVYNTHKGE